MYEIGVFDFIFICFMISIAGVSLFYLVETLVHATRNYNNKKETINQFKESREKYKSEQEDFWEKRRKESNRNFDEMMAEFNRKNEESMNRINEHIRRMEQEQRRRVEEAQRQIYAANAERQKLIAYMNVVGISNYPFTKEEISKKRRVLSLKYHPDRNGGKDTKMKKVNEACDYLEKIAQG